MSCNIRDVVILHEMVDTLTTLKKRVGCVGPREDDISKLLHGAKGLCMALLCDVLNIEVQP